MLSSLFGFSLLKYGFLMLIFDIQLVSRIASPSLYSFLSMYLFIDFSVGNCHLFHQNFIIITVHQMFWYLFRSCMLPATIVEMHKFLNIQFSIPSNFFSNYVIIKTADEGPWIVFLKASLVPWLWEWHITVFNLVLIIGMIINECNLFPSFGNSNSSNAN